MEYGRLKGIDVPVSRIVFGTATPVMFQAFRSVYGAAPGFDSRLSAAFELLDRMYALGINTFDAADHYGEEPLGEWLEARGLREKCVILTKGAHHNAWRKRVTDYDILHDCHNSRAKLKTDRIDLYLLHRDDPQVPVAPIIDVLNRLRDENKIVRFGASNWTVRRMEEANEYAAKCGLAPFTLASPHFSLAVQVRDPWGGGCVTLSGPEHAADRAWYAQNDIPVFAYSPLSRGFFSGAFSSDQPDKARTILDDAGVKGYDAPENYARLKRAEQLAEQLNVPVGELALSFIFNQQPLDVYALTGSTNADHVKSNIRALSINLTSQQVAWLEQG